MTDATQPHRVVIVGGGFGGLYAAKALRRAPVDVTLIDRRNFHLFQPLLYQVATGGLSPGDIAAPLRWVVKRQKNTRVLLDQALDVDAAGRRLITRDGSVEYDTLIVATGVAHHYFGREEWRQHAPGLKTIEDATEMRRRILFAFEAAEREPEPAKRRSWLNFIVVGAGPTGVELAGAVSELARDTLRHDFRAIDPTEARITLLEGSDRVLPGYPAILSAKARGSLEQLGVEVRLNTLVTEIASDHVVVSESGRDERIETRTVLWAAGIKASPLGEVLRKRAGAVLDALGRVLVEPDLSVAGHPEIMIIGDLCVYTHQGGEPLPGVAPVAMQQGRYAARIVKQRLAGKPARPFRYRDKGSLATIGRAAAVADFGFVRFWGYPAWLLWIFVHIAYLIGFENRLLVLIQWAWNYLTRNRGARLIVGRDTNDS